MNVIAGDQTAVIGQNYIGVSNVDMGIRQGKQFADQLFRLVRFNSVFAENLIMVDCLRSVQGNDAVCFNGIHVFLGAHDRPPGRHDHLMIGFRFQPAEDCLRVRGNCLVGVKQCLI